MEGDGVLGESDQYIAAGCPASRIAPHNGHATGKAQRLRDRFQLVMVRAVKAVHRDDEGDVVALEIVDRWKAVREPTLVRQHYRAERAVGQVVPHEPESPLTRGPEEVDKQIVTHGDPAEVHRHRGRRLLLHAVERVDELAPD